MRPKLLGVLAAFILMTFADAKPVRRPLEPEPPPPVRSLDGVYGLSYKGSSGESSVRIRIWNHRGNTFLVGIAEASGLPSVDWQGRGVLDGDGGYYDWEFVDGKKGRTTFTIDKQGNLHGQVRGSGIDWDYVGRRVASLPR